MTSAWISSTSYSQSSQRDFPRLIHSSSQRKCTASSAPKNTCVWLIVPAGCCIRTQTAACTASRGRCDKPYFSLQLAFSSLLQRVSRGCYITREKKCSDWSKTAIKDTRQLSALTTDTNTLIMLCLQRHKHVSLMITAYIDQITAQSQQTN